MPRSKDNIKRKETFRHESMSLCPECLKPIIGVARETSSGVVMQKFCPEHGSFNVIISNNLDRYRELRRAPRKIIRPTKADTTVDKGCPNDCGLCPSHDQHTCLAVLEITSRCDLQCPVCLAASRPQGHDLELGAIESALRNLITSEGRATPLQLSGGEPTLHPDLVNIVRLASSLGFAKIELDTNGQALGTNPFLAESLKEAGLSGVYLQMDSIDPGISEFFRGKDLIEQKLKAMENCKWADLQVVLSVTVLPGFNDTDLWQMIRFAAERRLTGINFQAMTLSGRFPKSLIHSPNRFTQGHFLLEIEKQSDGKLLESDFVHIPCPDHRCGLLSYVLIQKGELIPLKRLIKEEKLFDFVADLTDWEILIRQMGPDLTETCGCFEFNGSKKDLGTMLSHSDFFSVGYHGMMDAYNFDLERARRCCVHELASDGRLIPFCLYNIKYRESF